MPKLTRWYIKSAMLYFVAAMVLGILLAMRNIVRLPGFIAFMTPAFFHMLMVGWVTQMIFGVAYWMFPTVSRERPRGSAALGWTAYTLLNGGLLLRVLGEPLVGVRPHAGWGWILAASALLQWLAGLGFVINTWPRVRGKWRRL
ncbi:MAG: hypothetical protein ACE5E7_03380 [Anaerolineae bacterium]